MPTTSFVHLGGLRDVESFRAHIARLQIHLPCDDELNYGGSSPLAQPIDKNRIHLGNRFAIQPMEGWDGTTDGRPTDLTFRRWKHFGASGAKLIWGGEAVAVRHDGRANPNQLAINKNSKEDLSALRETLVTQHHTATGSITDLLVGLQLTHSGRYSRPNAHHQPEPKILYHHPILDRQLGITPDQPVLSDADIRGIVEDFCKAAILAQDAGFDFIDIKHCHGYLGHEFLSAYVRDGEFGGTFENRTRFLREVVQSIRACAPRLLLGVRLSAFDTVPFQRDPMMRGVPETFADLLPYRWAFGVNVENPIEPDLREPIQFMRLLSDLGVKLVNISAGSPYYNPHLQRPALYPPSDGYLPPEDPLLGVARQMEVTRTLKQQFPEMIIVGSAYSYLQEFLPHVAQAAVREGWTDCVGLGRMILTYPSLPIDVIEGRKLLRKSICRTFSDCTTAPRAGLPSGCYPLDPHYKQSENAVRLKELKHTRTRDEN
jgi:2,4-dienoyl-CoA reductase-like NADH-dependent reductase (Old Yellow Enzyme family)